MKVSFDFVSRLHTCYNGIDKKQLPPNLSKAEFVKIMTYMICLIFISVALLYGCVIFKLIACYFKLCICFYIYTHTPCIY